MATTQNNTPSETRYTAPQPSAPADSGSDTPGFTLAPPPGSGGSGGSSGGSGGSSGGSGGGAKAPDPYAPIMRSFFSAYFKIWGTLPPPGYVEGAARSMNLYEFIDQERKKPAYRHTKAYKNEAAKYAALRDQLLGYY